MKGFKRFLAIFGICFGSLVGFVGIFFAIVAITGGFNPEPVDITKMSFASSDGSAPGEEISKISIIDSYSAKVFYEPSDATQRQLTLTLVGDGADIVTLSSTTVNAGENFTITPKKRAVTIGSEEYQLNVGGEVEIIATAPNNYRSCKLFITVDVEVPVGGLQAVGMDGGSYVYSDPTDVTTLLGYKLNRVGSGLFKLAIQTTPSNALEPNTGRYSDAENIGYKKAYITLPEDSGFSVVGNPETMVSYYSAASKKYFAYSSYSTSATRNENGTFSLTVGGIIYSDLIICEHYVYTLQLSEDIANNNYNVVAKVFKTYDIQRDFLAMQSGFADHRAPSTAEYPTFCNFVAKYKDYIKAEPAGEIFLNSVTNSVGDIQINTPEGYNAAMNYLYVSTNINFIVEDIDIASMNTESLGTTFELHSGTYSDNDVDYNLNELTKEELISIFGLNLSVVGSSTPITRWVGDIMVLSLKGITGTIEWDDIIQVNANGTLSVKEAAIDKDNGGIIKVTYAEGKYKIEILDELLTDSHPVLLFATKYGDGETFTTSYKFCTVAVSNVTSNIASSLVVNTNTSTGGINTTMVTNPSLEGNVKEQIFDETTILVGDGQRDPNEALSYDVVKLFAVDEAKLFVGEGTAYPKVLLGNSGEKIKYIMNGSEVAMAYELPKKENGEYYLRALNNSGGDGNSVKIFAAIVKTDINGDVIIDEANGYTFINKSADVSIDINTYAEASDLNWYIKSGDNYYKKGVLSASAENPNADLKLLLYENYDILATLYDINRTGEVQIPEDVETGVNYLYNMGYAFADFSSSCNTTSKFKANEGTGIFVTSAIAQQEISTGINAVKITLTTLKSTVINTPINQRKLIAEGYSNNGIEISISRISIKDPVISLQGTVAGEIGEMALSGTHRLNPLTISKEFANGNFLWTTQSGMTVLTSPNGVMLTYSTDIDPYMERKRVIWSPKIDEAFRTNENIALYNAHLALQFTSGEGEMMWTSSDTSVATLSGTNNDELTMLSGTFAGKEFNISCKIDTYLNNQASAGTDSIVAVAYLKAREYPAEINLYSTLTGNISNGGVIVGTNGYVDNSTTQRLYLSSTNNGLVFISATPNYIVSEDGNVILKINAFDDLFRASGYSLAVGDKIAITGDAKFEGELTSITITNEILTSKELNIILTDYSATSSVGFEITKKNVNIYTDSMRAGDMVVITSANANFYAEASDSYNNCIVITETMIVAKQVVATLQTLATTTEITFITCTPERTLNSEFLSGTVKSFKFVELKNAIPEGGSLVISLNNAVFAVTNDDGTTDIYSNVTITEDSDLSKYVLVFDFENSDDVEADFSYNYYDADDVASDAQTFNLKSIVIEDGSVDAKVLVDAKDYSYKTTKLIDVRYNGVDLLTGTKSLTGEATVLTFGGVTFELSSGFTWVLNEENVSILASGENGIKPLEITVSINGTSRVLYATYEKTSA